MIENKRGKIEVLRKSSSLRKLENEILQNGYQISTNLGEFFLTNQLFLVYNITAEDYFINKNSSPEKQGYYRAPNTEIVKRRIFSSQEIIYATKVIPGYIEEIRVELDKENLALELKFFRDNDFRRMYLRGLFGCCCKSNLDNSVNFKNNNGKFLPGEKIREIYLREFKRV